MKRLLSFAVVTLAVVMSAQAQYRPSGPPASVTSTQANAPNGAPLFTAGPTVTSGSFSPVFPNPLHNRRHGNGRHGSGNGGRFGNQFTPAWAFSPTLVPVPVDADGNPLQAGVDPAEDESPALTVFEHRSRTAIPPTSYEPRASRMQAANGFEASSEPISVPDQPATLLVFRDGHQLEITNYAIQSGTLFNLSDIGPRKIALADLDVDKTVKANDERGVDFTMPAAR